ncbi:MAG: hypothetical protein DMG93_02720 [Acidobacteria bacterium]|nr:MAG: hypothetical protein DMG93_02720 [Acidobacteriota bacterium]
MSLTAYVLRFLEGTNEFVEVDPQVTSKARSYLISQQTPSGAWTRYDWSTKDQKDDPIETAYVARALMARSISRGQLRYCRNHLEAARAHCECSRIVDAIGSPRRIHNLLEPGSKRHSFLWMGYCWAPGDYSSCR